MSAPFTLGDARPQFAPFHIGPVPIAKPLVLAPMSGVTDTAFRQMVQEASGGAVGLLVTEFVSIEGLTRQNMKAALRLAFDPEREHPLSIQIFGGEVDRMVQAAQMAADTGAAIVDINCGCPAPKVVRRGGGAELMRNCAQLEAIVEQVVKAVSIPVTVKIRAGWDQGSINAIEVAKRCEAAGAQAIAVHGRTRAQMYTGRADWELVAEVARSVRVPVIGSGDITSPEAALGVLTHSPIRGVMIGRAAIMNPWIFGQIADVAAGLPARVVSPAERVRILRLYSDLQSQRMPESVVPGRLKQVLARMTKGFSHGNLLRERAMRVQTTAEMFDWIESFFAAQTAVELEAWCQRARTKNPD
jgi:nifR3 family TIM-barrel protein